MSKYQYKKCVKDKIAKAAFKYLEGLKSKHSKIKDIKYKKLQIQAYILDEKLRMIKVKGNFSKQFG